MLSAYLKAILQPRIAGRIVGTQASLVKVAVPLSLNIATAADISRLRLKDGNSNRGKSASSRRLADLEAHPVANCVKSAAVMAACQLPQRRMAGPG